MSKSKHRPRRNFNSSPSWFKREFTTIPNRRYARRLERKAVSLIDLDDLHEWPVWNRPRPYYW